MNHLNNSAGNIVPPPGEEKKRAATALGEAGCDFVLLSSLANVTYVSGWEVPVPIGAGAELSFGIPLAVVAADAAASLIVPNSSLAAAMAQSGWERIAPFSTFDSFEPSDSRESYLETVRATLREAGLENATATVGVEGRTMPYAVSELLAREFPKLRLVEAGDALQKARLIKTEREIALLRRAAAVGDAGHHKLAELCRTAGHSEWEMWGQITASMHRVAAIEIPVTGELVTGPRTSVVAYPAGPRERTTEPGDAALMDISGRVAGYWFDCTNTHVIGDVHPTAHQQKYACTSQAACEAAMTALKPGAKASDAAEAARQAFEKHGLPMAHYAGHQIGVAVNELPRLVPYDHTPIEAGMVFSVEPGAYEGEGGTFGARSEKIVLVTETGPEILSRFDWGIRCSRD